MDIFELFNLMDSACPCPIKCQTYIVRKSPCEIDLRWSFSLKEIEFAESCIITSFEDAESIKRSINSAKISIRNTLDLFDPDKKTVMQYT